jgi:EAL domain-containing protein (putative c-di-GMP-specific phosphodiesterase class I)
VQFRHPGLAATVAAALAAAGLAPDRLELEIAERVLLQDCHAALATLMQLKDLGVRIAIGDFGTAESSLSYLRRFRFDKIKIDRSFIHALDGGRDPEAIVKAVVGLAHSLGMETCAEGVERIDQLRLLEHDGCDQVQGHLFSKPLPPAALAAFVERAAAHPPLREIGVDSAGLSA